MSMKINPTTKVGQTSNYSLTFDHIVINDRIATPVEVLSELQRLENQIKELESKPLKSPATNYGLNRI